jgi:hypothetical protein
MRKTTEIKVVIEDDDIEVRPENKCRSGWADAFREMSERKDDELGDELLPTNWDNEK